ncbi:MAG: zinc-ribbon domain-containing protein [candidate division Zixibacteria bacterium]|nr:zinc-ribbon domain-containing protein [candidate division Zixibacteria bacterium]
MESGFEPRVLICCDCGEEFVFTAGAQEYFAERGFSEDPKRCKACHTLYKKNQRLPQPQPTDAAYQQPDLLSPE